MVEVFKIYPKGFAANCYLVTADGSTAIAIDPAQPQCLQAALKKGLTVTHVLLTHGHFDHIGGCSAFQKAGAKVGCSEREKALATGKDNMAEAFHAPVAPFRVDFTVKEGQTLALNGITVTVIETPGHTKGSVCYLIENYLFTGDTLFAGGVGRTDLPTGSDGDLHESLHRLRLLDDGLNVFAGHGVDSTLGYEKKENEALR